MLLQPVLTEVITIRAATATAYVMHPTRAAPPDGSSRDGTAATPPVSNARAAIPLLEKLDGVELALRIPSKRDAAAAAGAPFLTLEIELTTRTVHLGLQPADLRVVMALWFDNLFKSYIGPHDPKRALLPRAAVSMRVSLLISQARSRPSVRHGVGRRAGLPAAALDATHA